MREINDFTAFDAFQRCRDFARAIAEPLNGGVFSMDPVLVTQLRRTVISVYSNFAEGFERDGNREFSQFVSISKGSVGEARGQLLYAVDFGYLDFEKFQEPNAMGQRAGQCLGGLMRYLNTTEVRDENSSLHTTEETKKLDDIRAPNAKRQTQNAKRRTQTPNATLWMPPPH